jgi:hypothetical protein
LPPKLNHPFSVFDGRPDLLPSELDGDRFTVIRPTPDWHSGALLQNHVVREQGGKFDLRTGIRGRYQRKRERGQE